MTTICLDDTLDDNSLRERVYAGDLCLHAPTAASLELCELARTLIREALPNLDPEFAQFQLPVERYASILAELKPRFIHHPDAKRIIHDLLIDLGCDPEQTYFDVPRMRTATSHDYLTTGIAYAFHPHRDTWYSAPLCQVNWWMPIFPVRADNAMAFHPKYWKTGLRNSSDGYNYQNWNATSRFNAAQHIKSDTRVQPRALEPVELEPDIRVLPPAGGILRFSAAQLHSTVPNSSGRTRFSIDFRTVHRGDAEALRGAHNVDSYCSGSALPDFLRVSDLAHLPEDVLARYMGGHPQRPPAARLEDLKSVG